MKKLVLSACAVAFVFGATDIKAEDTPTIVTEEQSCAQDGFYAGLGLGVNYTEVLLDDYETAFNDHNYENHNKGSNPMLSVVLGYMWHVKERFHIGLEASVDLGKACIHHHENQMSVKYLQPNTPKNPDGATPDQGFSWTKMLPPICTVHNGGNQPTERTGRYFIPKFFQRNRNAIKKPRRF